MNKNLPDEIIFLRSLAENTPIGVLALNAHGEIAYSNEALAAHFSTDRSQMEAGIPIFPVIENIKGLKNILMDGLNYGWSNFDLHRVPHRHKVLSVKGRLAGDGLLLVTEDMTIYEERERELRETQDLLMKENEDLRLFLHRITHDLRSPFASVIGLLNLARLEIKDIPSMKYLNKVDGAIRRLDDILGSMLDVAYLTREKKEHQKIDFRILVAEIVELLRDMPGFKEVELDINIKQPYTFHGDRKAISSIILNLLCNAIKYRNRSRKAIVNFSLHCSEDAAYVKVEDNGIGISQEFQEKVFEMFFRANNEENGSGLGLYLVKTAVEKNKGTIQLTSAEGEGTSISIKLMNAAFNTN